MWFIAAAHAITPDALRARVDEVAPLRAQSLAEHAPPIPADVYDDVAKGKVRTGLVNPEGSKARKIWGTGIVDVPIARFFSAVNDGKNKPTYSKLSHDVALKGEHCGADRTVFQLMPVPMVSDRWWTSRQQINVALQDATGGRVRELVWTPAPDVGIPPDIAVLTAKGLRVTHTYGGWFLIDLGEGQTLVEFWSWSDPGGNVPAGLAASFASGSIEDTFETMATLANAGPACSL